MQQSKLNRGLKLLGAGVALCFTVLLGTGLNASPAEADTFDPNATYRFTNEGTYRTFDIEHESLSNGAKVHQWTDYKTWNQQWRIQSTGDGYYKLVNANSGKVADVSGSSFSNGADIVQWDYLGTDNQKWSIVPEGSSYRIVSKLTGKVLDVEFNTNADGNQIHQWDSIAGIKTQLWKIEQVNAPVPGVDPGKFYKIKSGSQVLDVYGGSTSIMKLQLSTDINSDSQKWQVVPSGWYSSPAFNIINKKSKKSVGAITCTGTRCLVQQVGSQPLMRIDYVSPGAYKIGNWGSGGYIHSAGDLYTDSSMPSLFNTFTFELAP